MGNEFEQATPRPWRAHHVEQDDYWEVVDARGVILCEGLSEENARGVANAVNAYEPMRSSLDRLRRVLDAMHESDNGARRDPLRIAGLLAQARQEVAAALRAADGEVTT